MEVTDGGDGLTSYVRIADIYNGNNQEYYLADGPTGAGEVSPAGLTYITLVGDGGIEPAPTVTAVASGPSTVTFPASPTLNQSFTSGTRTWVYNGTAWKLQAKTTDAITEGTTNKYYTDARVAAAPAVTALETRAGTIESAASTLAGRVTTAEGDITTLQGDVASVNTRVDNVLSNTDPAALDSLTEIVSAFQAADSDLNGAITSLANSASSDLAAETTARQAADTALDTRVTTLEGEMDAAEGRLTTVESDISSITGSATSLTTRVTTAESDIDALETRAGTIESAATTLAGRVTTAESDIDAIETAATALTTRVTTAESDIDALETGKQIKNVLSATAPSHVEGLVWIDTTDMSSYVSYDGAWIELDRV
jgi:trimeric autotransporter adhesin